MAYHITLAVRHLAITIYLIGLQGVIHAQTVDVEVNLNQRREAGGVSTFERHKFITLHSDNTENDWLHGTRDADNFADDLLDDFMNGRDVYFGRNSGYITFQINSVLDEDPDNPGWARPSGSPDSMDARAQIARNNYEAKTEVHPYEFRSDGIVVAQIHPFWPDGKLTNKGWAFSQTDTESEPFGSAVGDYMGRFLDLYYDKRGTQSGPPTPNYVEVINEPDWDLIQNGTTPPIDIWNFHNTVAEQIRIHSPETLVGGYTTAFPDPDNNNFEEWNSEWKSFIEVSGNHMDFWSLHLYDFPAFGNDQIYRKGSRIEAMFDIIDYYSEATLGVSKPYVISEYASQVHNLRNQDWSPQRDWLIMKGISSMMMSFMDRPHLMLKTIPFIVVKAEWGRNQTTGTPYNPRLMRQANEPASYTGEWVYTEIVKFYDLWANVKGTRIDITSSDLDIQVDAYIDGNMVYVVLNNLVPNEGTSTRSIALNLLGLSGNVVQSIREKNLYWDGTNVVLEDNLHTSNLPQVEIGSEGTIILEYTLNSPVEVRETLIEKKVFANEYLQTISANTARTFHIDDIDVTRIQRAELRLGIGRSTALSKQPTILLNGKAIATPANIMGRETDDRSDFFGLLHVPVSKEELQSNNIVDITFPDDSGHISTVSLRYYSTEPNFTSWIQAYELTEMEQAYDADPDDDGIQNLYEYASGGDPTNGFDAGTAPRFAISDEAVELIHITRKDASDIAYQLQLNHTLHPDEWIDLTEAVTRFNDLQNGFLQVRRQIPLQTEPTFIRLRIETK